MIHSLCGSTIVTLELADFLQKNGAKVNVYTYFCDNPAKAFFNQKKILIKTPNDNPRYKLSNLDYIWVHSQVLPLSIVKSLGRKTAKKIPKFIFLHMSPFDYIPDERPYIYQLEEKLSSKSLFNSTETFKKVRTFFSKEPHFELFQNPAPIEFSQIKHKTNKQIKKILIVSNHPPAEILEACQKLSDQHISTTIFGENGNEYKIITNNILNKYDLVITIGKTVQYCLVMGIPVYIYDHFGGCGYLNDKNFVNAMNSNFSGRETQKHDTNFLIKDILERYNQSILWNNENHSKMINKFTIDKVLLPILKNTKPKKIKKFNKVYCKMVLNAQIFAQNRFEANAWRWNEFLKNQHIVKEIKNLNQKLNKKRNQIYKIKIKLSKSETDFNKITSSKSYKLSLLLAWPIRQLRGFKKLILKHT